MGRLSIFIVLNPSRRKTRHKIASMKAYIRDKIRFIYWPSQEFGVSIRKCTNYILQNYTTHITSDKHIAPMIDTK